MILKEVAALVDSEAEAAANSNDPAMRSVGESYSNTSIEPDPTAEAKFNELLKKKIDNHIDSYKEHFKPHQLEELKRDCKAAIV